VIKLENLIRSDQAANMLGLKPRTIQAWLRSGKLKGIKLGSVWRIKLEEVNQLLLANGCPSPKLSRIPEPLLRLQFENGRAVTVVESTDGLLLMALNGKPKAMIKPSELTDIIRSIIKSSGCNRIIAELVGV
jgi:excisionase family DNA binding protein